MAKHPLSLAPVFLSASVPDPNRNPKYFSTGDTVAIRDAVLALVTVVVPKTKLVFGGHPAITPMVKWVADQMGAFDNVRMFQSMFFRDQYLKDIEVFGYEEIEAVRGDREASLLEMRARMLLSEPFGTAFFIGGMEGVEREYELLKELKPDVSRFPVYTTGAAARILWEIESNSLNDLPESTRLAHAAELQQIKTSTSYTGLFTSFLERTGEFTEA